MILAELDSSNYVLNVLVFEGKTAEEAAAWIKAISGNDSVEISENNQGGIGWLWRVEFQKFQPPAPYPSWHFSDSNWRWEPPIVKPEDGDWNWSELTQSWETASQGVE